MNMEHFELRVRAVAVDLMGIAESGDAFGEDGGRADERRKRNPLFDQPIEVRNYLEASGRISVQCRQPIEEAAHHGSLTCARAATWRCSRPRSAPRGG
jgi:hypothetical protein